MPPGAWLVTFGQLTAQNGGSGLCVKHKLPSNFSEPDPVKKYTCS